MAADPQIDGQADAGNGALDSLLPRGITPEELCTTYFQACWDHNPKLFLATLDLSQRSSASSDAPGPFFSCAWELGRARVEKYMVQYKLKEEGKSMTGYEPLLELLYVPQYGPVPGYVAGDALGKDIKLQLKKQGGPNGEWRISGGEF